MSDAPAIRLIGGRCLDAEHGLEIRSLGLSEGVIAENGGRAVDASGYLLLPGIVDLHGDGFERHLAPRRGAVTAPQDGLPHVERELAAAGITTAVLAQFYSWEGGMRGPAFAEALATALAATPTLLDLHMQLRVETSMVEDYPDIQALIDRFRIDYVVLNDHLPHKALEAGKRPPRLTGQALKAGRSPEAHWALLRALHSDMVRVPAALPELCASLLARGVHLGSHDDTTALERRKFRDLGARICEFPETRAAAEEAKAAGDPVIMGAPNVVRGGSHDGKVSAASLVHDGLVDALVSDYHYPALIRAAFRLVDDGMSLAAAWRLVSQGPAKILGLTDRGDLSPGARADVIVVNETNRQVEASFVAGRPVFLSGRFAARVMEAEPCV